MTHFLCHTDVTSICCDTFVTSYTSVSPNWPKMTKMSMLPLKKNLEQFFIEHEQLKMCRNSISDLKLCRKTKKNVLKTLSQGNAPRR